MTLVSVLNTLVLIGILVTALCAVVFEKPLSAVIALGVTGALVSLEFILLQAPDVAIAEAAVGAVLTTIMFVVTIRYTTPKEDEEK